MSSEAAARSSLTASWVERARGGDAQAREALFESWLPVVAGWCARLGGPRVNAEDAASDVLVIVLRRIDGLEDPDRFGSWVFGITRRVLDRHRRRAWVVRWTGDVPDDTPDPSPSLEANAAEIEMMRKVHELLAELPRNQREVFVLAAIEGRTKDEVARLLNIPPGTVASRMRLARQRFERLARARKLDALLGGQG